MKHTLLFSLSIVIILACRERTNLYVCPPCDLECDELFFEGPGYCPNCRMVLVSEKSLIKENDLEVNQIDIEQGSGTFWVEGGFDKSKIIGVHYHRPSSFTKASNVIMVLPGAGRNADDYRNAWIAASERYRVLVLALEYNETYYPGFWSYNLAGMIGNVDIENQTFEINEASKAWLFNDFDRIFNLVKEELHLSMDQYDMFGHSAGGQILHRLAIFKPKNQANRIVAANSGWYTMPTPEYAFPYGLGASPFKNKIIDFNANLVLFLGEKDDVDETRGHLRHGPKVDEQGLHRLARGTYFYEVSKRKAMADNRPFNWQLEIIPNVGHDYTLMSKKAAEYLYVHH